MKTKPTYYVDIPKRDDESWENVQNFTTRKAALKFAKERFGADEDGRITIVTAG